MASISAVIITKNEERNISRCLTAIDGLVDEVIVVDSHSEDSTEQICRGFSSVKFHVTDWKGYSATKNFANSLATGDYILSLDADEEVSPELRQEIEALKENLSGAHYLNRLTNYCGRWIRHSGWYPDFQLRLFPRQGSRWEGEIHERVQFDKATPTKRLKGHLNHYTVDSIEGHLNTVNRYSSLNAEKIVAKGKGLLILRALFNSYFRFIKMYFIKRGFLDGFEGLVISVISSFSVFLKYVKAYQLQKRSRD